MININAYNYHFSIGSNCRVATSLIELNLRKFSTNFDWGFFTPKSFYLAYIDNFQELINFSHNKLSQSENTYQHIIDNWISKYNFKPYMFRFAHRSHKNEDTVRRRAIRLKDTIENGNNKILFIYNHIPIHLMSDRAHKKWSNKLLKEEGEDIFDLKYLQLLKDVLPDNVDLLLLHYEELNMKFKNVYCQFINYEESEVKHKDWDQQLIIKHIKSLLN